MNKWLSEPTHLEPMHLEATCNVVDYLVQDIERRNGQLVLAYQKYAVKYPQS